MKNIFMIAFLAMLFANTFSLRTNLRIGVSNVLDFSSNIIHPYRSY